MEVAAKLKHARISPQKCRLVADQVRGLPVERALEVLSFSTKKASELIKKVLESAIANAEHNAGADIDELKGEDLGQWIEEFRAWWKTHRKATSAEVIMETARRWELAGLNKTAGRKPRVLAGRPQGRFSAAGMTNNGDAAAVDSVQ